jgi:hypothetical protein
MAQLVHGAWCSRPYRAESAPLTAGTERTRFGRLRCASETSGSFLSACAGAPRRSAAHRRAAASFGSESVGCCAGKPVDTADKQHHLLYNEFIVYDTQQVLSKFLLKVKFHYK